MSRSSLREWDPSPTGQQHPPNRYSPIPSTSNVEDALRRASDNAARYERRLRDLEGRLSEHLGNFRAMDSQMGEALGQVKNSREAAAASVGKVNSISQMLDMSTITLNELAGTLPTTKKQVIGIKTIYESGQLKAKLLVEDLNWLNTDFYERWRRTIFTTSPVSWRWKFFMRLLFAVSFVIWAHILWISTFGIMRAYRHRLLWGERLMS